MINIDKEGIIETLDAAVEDIKYCLLSKKDEETKEHYLNNAIRFIDEAKEKINVN